MAHTVQQIAEAIGAKAVGDTTLEVTGVNEPALTGATELALAIKPEFAETLSQGSARAAMLWDGADWQSMGLEAAILVSRPRFALAGLSAMMDPEPVPVPGIHPSAVVDPSATLGAGVSIGPLCVIEAGADIGAGSVIGAQCFVGQGAVIGAGARLREQVSIGARARIGARFIAQPGVRVGIDGFSFVTPEQSGVERARSSLGDAGDGAAQSWARIHSLGSVTIGEDVELGGNTSIDRGTVRDTQIGNRSKFDNLVHIGHNVVIGTDCLICAQVGIAGSTRVGNNVVMGGQCGASDNIFIGDNVVAGGATKMYTNVPAGRVVLGSPAIKMEKQVELNKLMRRLPRLFADVAALRKGVSKTAETD